MELSKRSGFSGNNLDRRAQDRSDNEIIASYKKDPAARFLIFDGENILTRRTDAGVRRIAFAAADILNIAGDPREWVFLGKNSGAPLFGCEGKLEADVLKADWADIGRLYQESALRTQSEEKKAGGENSASLAAFERMDIRVLVLRDLVSASEAGWLAEAKSLLDWHRRRRFCPQCGGRTQNSDAGWRRACESCAAENFPRVDPVVIMAPVSGNFCVLGRQKRFPQGMYSLLAGFIEPGETLEDAARREIFEEDGLRAGAVRYVASQPWPFPHSLMLGCLAEVEKKPLVVDRHELEDARWFSKQEAANLLQGARDGLFIPPPLAIAHHLLAAWVKDEA